ncbi:hypothetical protein AERO9A_370008 [Aeromonas salmonicida]|nr:hypothetical protein AERO9A_370008 [Aeromonas salmonicida]
MRLVFRLLSYYFFDLKRKNKFFTHQILRQALVCMVLKGSCLSSEHCSSAILRCCSPFPYYSMSWTSETGGPTR